MTDKELEAGVKRLEPYLWKIAGKINPTESYDNVAQPLFGMCGRDRNFHTMLGMVSERTLPKHGVALSCVVVDKIKKYPGQGCYQFIGYEGHRGEPTAQMLVSWGKEITRIHSIAKSM